MQVMEFLVRDFRGGNDFKDGIPLPLNDITGEGLYGVHGI